MDITIKIFIELLFQLFLILFITVFITNDDIISTDIPGRSLMKIINIYEFITQMCKIFSI
jgi:hypothetical protein